MKITGIRYVKKFNIGNYESEQYGISAIIEEDNTKKISALFKELKQEVAAAHGGEKVEQDVTEVTTTSEPKPKKGKDPKREDSPPAAEKEEEIEGEEEAPDPRKESVEIEEEDKEGNGSDEEEVVEKNSKKLKEKSKPSTDGAEKAGKKFKKQTLGYQRVNETHKEIFSGLLKEVCPDWKKSEASKIKAKAVSQKMEGAEFLDEQGNVLESFKHSVKKQMGGKK